MRHVVMLSGGVGSWATADRTRVLIDAVPQMLFADTLIEDDDCYRFLIEGAAYVAGTLTAAEELLDRCDVIPPVWEMDARRDFLGALAKDACEVIPELHWIRDGRDVWQVFLDRRFLGNTRVDLCSRILKRELMESWLKAEYDPADTTVYLGMDWTEIHRYERAKPRWEPWTALAPLTEPGSPTKEGRLAKLRELGIEPPRLYAMGFEHNNCGGFCIKAGQAQFAKLLFADRELYLYHERKEEWLREQLDKNVAILRDRTGGKVRPLTMREFRERLEKDATLFDHDEFGACSCVA